MVQSGTDKKVIVRIFGGLGNQLFCYAAARRLALANGMELVIDHTTGFTRDHLYKRTYELKHFNIPCRLATNSEKLEPFSSIRRPILRNLNSLRSFAKRTYICQEFREFDSRLLDLQLTKTVILEGYWQSEQYFSGAVNQLRHDLKIQQPADLCNLSMAASIKNQSSIAIHVRYFDSPTVVGGSNLNTEYYSKAINKMEQLSPGSHYYLFSDMPQYAMKSIGLPEERCTLVSCNTDRFSSHKDMWLASQCNHFIIANSTFSWWSAWLSESPSKIIIAPGVKFISNKTAWGFNGLIPSTWLKI